MGFKSSMFPKSSIKSGSRLISNIITTTMLSPTLLWSGKHSRVSDEDDFALFFGGVAIIFVVVGALCNVYKFLIWILLSLACLLLSIFVIRAHLTNKKLVADAQRVRSAKEMFPITPLLSHMLRNNIQLEIYFHFVYRPLMTKEEFNQIHWSDRCGEYYKKYKQYKKDWYKIYWHYSLQLKAHHLLTQLLNEDYIPEKAFQQTIKKRLHENLCFSEKRIIKIKKYSFKRKSESNLLNHSQYWKLWDNNKVMDIHDLLHQDFLNRMQNIAYDGCGNWGAIWNSDIINTMDRYYSSDATIFAQINNIELVLIDTTDSPCVCQLSHTRACPYTFIKRKQHFVISQNDIQNICDVAWKVLAPHVKEFYLMNCITNNTEPMRINVDCHFRTMHFAIQTIQ